MSWVEKNLEQMIWSSFEQLGYEVWGEQKSGSSRFDLVCRSKEGRFTIVEFKGGPALNRFTMGNKILKQLYEYLGTNSLKGIVFCVPEQDKDTIEEFKTTRLGKLSGRQPERNIFVLERMFILSGPLFPPATAKIPSMGLPEQEKLPFTPSHQNEAEITHTVWNAVVNSNEFLERVLENLGLSSSFSVTPVCEGLVRGDYSSTKPEVDMALVVGSRDTLECEAIVGIEFKNSLSDPGIQEQLEKYMQSETLSQLYLAVPANLCESAKRIVSSVKSSDRMGVMILPEKVSLESFARSYEEERHCPVNIVEQPHRRTEHLNRYIAPTIGNNQGRSRAIYGSDELFDKYVRQHS